MKLWQNTNNVKPKESHMTVQSTNNIPLLNTNVTPTVQAAVSIGGSSKATNPLMALYLADANAELAYAQLQAKDAAPGSTAAKAWNALVQVLQSECSLLETTQSEPSFTSAQENELGLDGMALYGLQHQYSADGIQNFNTSVSDAYNLNSDMFIGIIPAPTSV